MVKFSVCLLLLCRVVSAELEHDQQTQNHCSCEQQSALLKEKDVLSEKLTRTEENEKRLKEELDVLQKEVERLTARVQQRKQQLEIADKELIRYSDRIQARDANIKELKQSISDLQKDVENKNTQLGKINEEHEKLQSANFKLTQEVQKAKQDLDEVQGQFSQQKSAHYELKGYCDQMAESKLNLEKEVEALKSQLEEAENSKDIRSKYEGELAQMQSLIESERQKVEQEKIKGDQLEQQVIDKRKEIQRLEDALELAKSQIKTYARKNEALEKNLGTKQDESSQALQKLKQEKEEMEEQLAVLRGEVSRKDMVQKEFINQRDSLDEQLTQSRKKSLQQQRQLQEYDQQLKEAADTIEELNVKIEELSKNNWVPIWLQQSVQQKIVDPVMPYVRQVTDHPYTKKSVQFYVEQMHPQIVKTSKYGYKLAKSTSQKIVYEYYPVAQERVKKYSQQTYNQMSAYATMVANSPQFQQAQQNAWILFLQGVEQLKTIEAELHTFILINMKQIPQLEPFATPQIAIVVVYMIIVGATMFLVLPVLLFCCRDGKTKSNLKKSQQFITKSQKSSSRSAVAKPQRNQANANKESNAGTKKHVK